MSSTTYIDQGCKQFIENSKDIEKSYAEACDWISNLGVVYEKTRFGTYERDIESFIKNRSKDD